MKDISLALQLAHTAQTLQLVHAGQSLDNALIKTPENLRPGVQALAYYALRNLGQGQVLLGLLAKKLPPPPIRALLWVSLILCAAQEDAEQEEGDATGQDKDKDGGKGEDTKGHANDKAPQYKSYVLVSQTVEAAKLDPKKKNFVPFINGVLRSFLRKKEHFLQESQKEDVARWNFQPWWIEQVQKDWPEQWEAILWQAQLPAPMTLRVNAKWGTPEKALQLLKEHQIQATQIGAYGVELEHALPVHGIPLFNEGVFSVQAAAAQLAAPLLLDMNWVKARVKALGRPLRVLDACAAPGGKTAHLLELGAPELMTLTAVDIDPDRLVGIEENISRIQRTLSLEDAQWVGQTKLKAVDISLEGALGEGAGFDAILLDAPCSASGIVSRHPDVRWLRRKEDIATLAKLQQKILAVLWQQLNPEGRLLYCTCSVFKEEGENNIKHFQQQYIDARKLPAWGHILPILKDSTPIERQTDTMKGNTFAATDGFYYALFEK